MQLPISQPKLLPWHNVSKQCRQPIPYTTSESSRDKMSDMQDTIMQHQCLCYTCYATVSQSSLKPHHEPTAASHQPLPMSLTHEQIPYNTNIIRRILSLPSWACNPLFQHSYCGPVACVFVHGHWRHFPGKYPPCNLSILRPMPVTCFPGPQVLTGTKLCNQGKAAREDPRKEEDA